MKHRIYKVRVLKEDGRKATYFVRAWTPAEAAAKQAGKGRVIAVEFDGERKLYGHPA